MRSADDRVPQVLVVSSSLDARSRSEQLAHEYGVALKELGLEVQVVSLKEHRLPRFDNDAALGADPTYRELHALSTWADGLVMVSPVYNWGCCSELKLFVELVGSTPPDGSLRSPFFDKVVTFVNAAGLPHSYMAFTTLAMSMVLDFKCILNPYHVYVHNRHWVDEALADEARHRLRKSATVKAELLRCLAGRSYQSEWEL